MRRDSILALTAAGLALALCGASGQDVPACQDVTFKADADGSEQKYVITLPAGLAPQKGAADLLLAFHGHGADRWQFIRDSRDECRAVRDFAKARGMILVSPDYRARTSWMGPKAEADVLQIIADLKRRHRVGRVFLAGGSMGGTAVLTFAALHPDLVCGVCSMNGTANLVEYDKFQDAIAASFGGTKAQIPQEYRNRSAELRADGLTMPIAFTVGGRDAVVPPQSVLRLAEKLRCLSRPVLLVHRQDGGHATTYEDARAGLEFMLKEALAAATRPGASTAPATRPF